MGSFGSTYTEFLEAAATPNQKKYEQRYKGRWSPAPILKNDAEIIKTYLDECVTNGLAVASAKTSASYLCVVSRQFPDFKKMDTKIAGSAFSALRSGMKPNSARRAMSIFKLFIRWMHDERVNTRIDLTKIGKIKPPAPEYETKKASNMLSGKEISLLIETAWNDRDRALIAMIFEGSLRPSEAVSATWGDLNFDQYGAQFTTSKKTGKPRYIRLIMAAPYLLKLKNNYHGIITNDSPIFVSFKKPHAPLTVLGLQTTFSQILKKSGIAKKVSPYYLRHSRITSMIADEIPDSVVKLQAWGSLSTNMLATYAHLQNSDIDKILLSRAGIVTEPEKVKDESLKPRQCPHCGKVHAPTTKFCDECGTGLTEEIRQSLEVKTREIEQNPRYEPDIEKIMARMKEMEEKLEKIQNTTSN
jgi:site-specific recombinase XerD